MEEILKNFAGIDKGFYSVGIDGCRDGWITAVIHRGELSLHKSVCFRETMDQRPFDACLVDMVIGLQGNEKQIRPDGMARKILKKRAPTVFSAPCRKAVYGETKEARLRANEQVLHKRFSRQTDAIIPKIREVDEFLQSASQYKNKIQESHPEVCFARLNGDVLLSGKHSMEGIKVRVAVIADYLPEFTVNRVMEAAKQMRCKPDDITDAVCLAIVANMLAQGRAETIPPEPMMDDTGLLMQMVIPKVVKKG